MRRSLTRDHLQRHLSRGGGVLEDTGAGTVEWRPAYLVDEWGDRRPLAEHQRGPAQVARRVWSRHTENNTRLTLTA